LQATPSLAHLGNDFLVDSFCPEGFIGIGVPIDTDGFVQSFVTKTCRDIIDDIEKLDSIQDVFIHFQFIRFFEVIRLQYISSHFILSNRCVLQQHHVDCKIADALLKKGTKYHTDGWDTQIKYWVHMVLHLPHDEGGFGVTINDVTKDDAFYTTTSHFVSWMLGWVISLRHVRSCGCLKMIFGTRPHGHRPHLCSYVTFTPSLLTSTTAKRSVHRLRHRSTQDLVLD
jgi:hypothetical protein